MRFHTFATDIFILVTITFHGMSIAQETVQVYSYRPNYTSFSGSKGSMDTIKNMSLQQENFFKLYELVKNN